MSLHIFLFGNVRIAHHDQAGSVSFSSPETKLTHMTEALLAYLVVQRRRRHTREALTSCFWPGHGPEQARSCLNTALWRLRRALEPAGVAHGTYLITTPQGDVGFNPDSDHWLDVAVFEAAATRALSKPLATLTDADAEVLKQALIFHGRDLLEGFYDDWAVGERERMREMFLNSLAHLMRYCHQCGAYEDGINYGRRILDVDPLREEVHRELMRLYLANGQRALAIQQFESCRASLAAELSIPPMPETAMLVAQIASQDARSSVMPSITQALSDAPTDALDMTSAVRSAHRRLAAAARTLDEARLQVQQALTQLDHLLRK